MLLLYSYSYVLELIKSCDTFVWCKHFSGLLGVADTSPGGDGGNGLKESDSDKQDKLDFSDRLSSPISPEEALWALNMVKKDAAPGQDGVRIMLDDCPFEVWLALFQVCWDYGLVPSVWQKKYIIL